jgi:hypothetical protein
LINFLWFCYLQVSKWQNLGIIFLPDHEGSSSSSSSSSLSHSQDIFIHFPNYSDDEIKRRIIQKCQKTMEDIFSVYPENLSFPMIQQKLKEKVTKIVECASRLLSYGISSVDDLFSFLLALWLKIYKTTFPGTCVSLINNSSNNSDNPVTSEMIDQLFPLPTITSLKDSTESLLQTTFLHWNNQQQQSELKGKYHDCCLYRLRFRFLFFRHFKLFFSPTKNEISSSCCLHRIS